MNMLLLKTIGMVGVVMMVMPGCGKHEASHGAIGTGAGAVLGASLAGGKSKGTGAILGGLIGNFVGREMGKSVDDEVESSERRRAYDRRRHQNELAQMEQENRSLQRKLDRWCGTCHSKVTIDGAHRCPDCGDKLIREKLCEQCHEHFSPQTQYRYCPYCPRKILLSSR